MPPKTDQPGQAAPRAKVNKNADGTFEFEVTKVENRRSMRPHEMVNTFLYHKKQRKHLEEELAQNKDVMDALGSTCCEIAEEQAILREAELERMGPLGERQQMEEEREWWVSVFVECGGDEAALRTKMSNARANAHAREYTHKEKLHTPR